MTNTDFIERDWIEWNGGECPVPPESRVWFMTQVEIDCGFTREKTEQFERPSIAGGLNWKHGGDWDDIIAYRVVKP